MADYIRSKIDIGGEIPSSKLQEIADLIVAYDGEFEPDEGSSSEEEIVEAAKDEDGELCFYFLARNGEVPELIEYLTVNRIPFEYHSDSDAEIDAEVTYYDGERKRTFLADSQGEPLVYLDVLSRAYEQLRAGNTEEAEKELQSVYMGDFVLPELKIIQG